MFKEYVMEDVFHKVELKRIKKTFDKAKDISKEQTSEFNLPLINAKNGDNGIMYYGRMSDWESDVFCIDIINDGAVSTGNVYAQPQRTGVLYNAYMIKPNKTIESEEILLFLAKTIEKAIKHSFGYDNKATWEKVKIMPISLPVIENANPNHEYTVDDIDWQYMRDRITELERDRITELEGYLQATGLNDYELTEDDVRYGKFVIGEIFNSQNGDNNLRKSDVNGKGVHIIAAGVKNNGILGLSDKGAKVINANTITVDMFGNVYFRDFNYKMTRSVFSLELKEGALSEEAGIYICSELKQLAELFDYDNMCSFNKIKTLSIELPIKSDGTPDFDYMERYIRAIEKVVIADVVKYKDKVIETTKKVVGE